MRASFALFRLLVTLSARAAYVIGAPIFFGIFIVSSILFGPTGMRAAEVTQAMRASMPLAALLWCGFLGLTSPAARVALAPKESIYLRWLPAPRALFYLAGFFVTLLVEAPMIVLFGRGEGLLASMTAAIAAAAGHALIASNGFSWKEGLAGPLFLCALLAPSPSTALPAAVLAALLAIPSAIRKTPESSGSARLGFIPKNPVSALATTHLLALLRLEPFVFFRAISLVLLGAVVFPLAARGHDLASPSSLGALLLGIAAFAVPPGLSGVGSAILRSERAAAWLCDTTGLSPRSRAFAAALATCGLGTLAGMLLGASAAFLYNAAIPLALRLVALASSFGLATGAVVAASAREASVSQKRGDRGMVYALLWTIASVVAASALGEGGIFLLVLVGLFFIRIAGRRAEVIRRKQGTS